METIERRHGETATTAATKLPLIQNEQSCDFTGYDADTLMKETARLRKLITKKGAVLRTSYFIVQLSN